MSLSDFFKKKTPSYDAAAEFFVTPELVVHETKLGGYALAIDTGYEDLMRTVKRINLDCDEMAINTQTSYVDFKEVFERMGIEEAPKIVINKPMPTILAGKTDTLSADKADGKDTPADSAAVDNPSTVDTIKTDSAATDGDKPDLTKVAEKNDTVVTASTDNTKPLDGSIKGSDLPEQILLKQKDVVESDVYYKVIKVASFLETNGEDGGKVIDIAHSYYLTPIGYIGGVYQQLSPAECSHIVETAWSDAYIEAMSDDIEPVRTDKIVPVTHAKNKFKAPFIVAASLAFAFTSLYAFNFYQQHNNPLSLAASHGNVGTYMNAKGMNTDEYTQRQLEATKAALNSMGIDVDAEADIGCLIE